MSLASLAAPSGADYSELRHHELRKTRMVMVDGNLTANASTNEGGTSARIWRGGYWGFASVPGTDPAGDVRVADKALANARTMSRFGARSPLMLPESSYQGEHRFRGEAEWSQQQRQDFLRELHAYCSTTFTDLKSSMFVLHSEDHAKQVVTSSGSRVLNSIQRAACYIMLIAEDGDGNPVEIMERVSGKGNIADLELSVDGMKEALGETYRHLKAKCHAVPVRGGQHTIVLASDLAGMLAHEAMGHPCEADLVLGGAVTGDLVGQRVASDLVTMVDFAHSYEGEELMVPVYCDDEGTPASDAVLIRDGILTQFMSSRETAARLDIVPTGNARGYNHSDEPLVRMRNTAILPGESNFEDMIADVEDGYLLMKTGNGQADSTTEFMFGITMGYEIREGKIGSAIRDTTVSGSAIRMLQDVDAVSKDMSWECSGYCGKKQPMVVSMGGPALRSKAHLGGE